MNEGLPEIVKLSEFQERNDQDLHRPGPVWPEDVTLQSGRKRIGGQLRFVCRAIFADGYVEAASPNMAGAERSCFAAAETARNCQHHWGRFGHLNEIGKCYRCGMSAKVFSHIWQKGSWRGPIRASEIMLLMEGLLFLDQSLPASENRTVLRIWCRLKDFGLALPYPPEAGSPFVVSGAYRDTCRQEAIRWSLRWRALLRGRREAGLSKIIDLAALDMLDRIIPPQPASLLHHARATTGLH